MKTMRSQNNWIPFYEAKVHLSEYGMLAMPSQLDRERMPISLRSGSDKSKLMVNESWNDVEGIRQITVREEVNGGFLYHKFYSSGLSSSWGLDCIYESTESWPPSLWINEDRLQSGKESGEVRLYLGKIE